MRSSFEITFKINPRLILSNTYYSSIFHPFVSNAPFLYPLKTSENFMVFWCFKGVKKRCIGNKWVLTKNCDYVDYCVTDICIWQTKKKRTVLSNICRSIFCLTKTTIVVTWQDEYFEEIIISNSLTTKKQICKAWLMLMKLLFFVPFTFMQLNLICSSWTVFY